MAVRHWQRLARGQCLSMIRTGRDPELFGRILHAPLAPSTVANHEGYCPI